MEEEYCQYMGMSSDLCPMDPRYDFQSYGRVQGPHMSRFKARIRAFPSKSTLSHVNSVCAVAHATNPLMKGPVLAPHYSVSLSSVLYSDHYGDTLSGAK